MYAGTVCSERPICRTKMDLTQWIVFYNRLFCLRLVFKILKLGRRYI